MAWVRASMPVAAVTLAGIATMIAGSSTAISGIRLASMITSFTWRWLSMITALLVSSAAVPAVVLMATKNTPGFFTLPTPEYAVTGPGLAVRILTPLAVSIGLPPPKAIR